MLASTSATTMTTTATTTTTTTTKNDDANNSNNYSNNNNNNNHFKTKRDNRDNSNNTNKNSNQEPEKIEIVKKKNQNNIHFATGSSTDIEIKTNKNTNNKNNTSSNSSSSSSSGSNMSMSSRSQIIELNNLNRCKLKRSLTYLLSHGYFQVVRTLIQSRAVDLNETDQWWILNPNINIVNKKCLVVRRDRYRILSRLQTSIDWRVGATQSAPSAMVVGRTPLMLCSMIENDSWAFSIAQVSF